MRNKYFLFIFFLNLCNGQFFYTGYQTADNWIKTSSEDRFLVNEGLLNSWSNYRKQKFITYQNLNHFGIFLNLPNNSNLSLIQEKSDLIGKGFLTNYVFSTSKMKIQNSIFFTDNHEEAKRGFVRTIKNVTIYTNQAYLKFFNNFDNLDYSIKIGRDFLIEGYSNESKIFFSDYSRPFDLIAFEAIYNKIKTKLNIISLNDLYENKRFLYMHTFSYESNKFNLSIGEAIISTGVNETLSIKYINPFNLWSWENLGSTNNGLNAFLYTGFSWTIKPSIRLYGEILIDDINFHQKNAFYLNKYAYSIGVQKTSFPFKTSNVWFEHSNVLNQVYQSFHPSHIYTHMEYPIGHFLGNDFVYNRLHYSQIINSKINKAFFDFSFLIKGQESLYTSFKNPWEDNNGKFDYNYQHPGFPTPPLNHIYEYNFGLEIKLKDYTYLILSLENQKDDSEKSYSKIIFRFWSYINIIK